jgi:hypothetical protein
MSRHNCGQTKEMRRQSRIIVDTLLGAEAHAILTKGALDAGFEKFSVAFGASAPLRLRLTLRAGIATATWIAPLLIGRPPPLTLYRRGTRERALEALAGSRSYLLRRLFGVVKLAVAMSYGADRDVREALGYPMQRTTVAPIARR